MTLDLKAKAHHLFRETTDGGEPTSDLDWVVVELMEQALKEVQDATRRETLLECAEIAGGCNLDPVLGEILSKEILALLTTPEKK